MMRYNYWIYNTIICFLFHEKVAHAYALFRFILDPGVLSSTPSQSSRRGFFRTIAVVSTMTSISQASAEAVSNLQNYKYSDTWVGTSLEVISAQDAAKWTDDLFPFGRWPDPILRRTASSVDFRHMKRTDLENICLKLSKTARDKGAVGLAAQQCGIDASIVFLDHPNSIDGEIFMINPRIINRSRELDMKVWTEECLVLPPTFRATLLRDAVVTVEYQNLDGDFRQVTLDGELARAFQHELDHDRGVLIVDHIGLDEMDPQMRFIEHIDHDQKMEKAFARFISDSIEIL